ncbi:MAG TPA: hypothetical protein VMB71_02525 [Acetobacteraceae bacterium]|nr:hypothetical protein [Acetobacteraceae bacterium]
MIHRAVRPLLAALVTLAGSTAHTQELAPDAVLSDTVEYCGTLQHLIVQHPVRPPDVNHLLVEGRRMCDHGEIRPGIFRLRRALWLLHHRPTEARVVPVGP